jgi:hypothetical protein
MKTLDTFLPYVLPYARHCDQSVAEHAILNAAIDFCEQSGILQATLTPISTLQGERQYALTLPATTELVGIKRAWFKGSELIPVATEAVGTPDAWRATVPGVDPQRADPQAFYQIARSAIGLYPRPLTSEADVLTVRAAIKPTREATELDDELFNDWVETVAAGALERLHSTPGVAYTDAAKAADRRLQFVIGVSKAKHIATFGRTRGELSVTMRPFA